MIKSLLNADEEPSPKSESVKPDNFTDSVFNSVPTEERSDDTHSIDDQKFEELFAEIERKDGSEPNISSETSENAFEVPEESKFFSQPDTLAQRLENISSMSEEELEKLLEDEEETYKTLSNASETPLNREKADDKIWEAPAPSPSETKNEETNAEVNTANMLDYEPETQAETIRKSGLAYSAAIILLASVVFMMILGWFADLIIGSSPWGVVGGIILGGIIGFVQFFRIASSIFANKSK